MGRPRYYLMPWLPGDETAFTPRADFAEERAAVRWNWLSGPPGRTWTVKRDHQVVAVGGVVWTGAYERQVWAWFAEPASRREWAWLILCARFALQRMREDDHGVLEARVRCGNAAGRRTLEHLGFEATGEVREAMLPSGEVSYDVMVRTWK